MRQSQDATPTGSGVHRRRIVLAAAALAGGASIAVTSIVFACTAVMGPLTLSPGSGRAGSTINASASGLKVYPARYAMHFTKNTNSGDCMSFTGVWTLKTITTSSQGTWSGTLTIPSTAALGTHGLCGMETYPIKGGTGTVHDTFTVT